MGSRSPAQAAPDLFRQHGGTPLHEKQSVLQSKFLRHRHAAADGRVAV
jgi:hypothetical protein